jgi:hypothetical protein
MQWEDSEPFNFPDDGSTVSQTSSTFGSQTESTKTAGYETNIDMLTAQLRTRYYYARYLLYRPYVYKALHHPKQMSTEDGEYCAAALSSMCLWPYLMAPPKSKKRLVPHPYAWTQNYLGMLLIFKAMQASNYTLQICRDRIGNERIQETVSLMLEWLRDAQQLDGTAEWGWKIVEPLFAQDDHFVGQALGAWNSKN